MFIVHAHNKPPSIFDTYHANAQRKNRSATRRSTMITIESRLAQEIVERTMKIIPFSVNAMDRHGIILASGKPSRIGELQREKRYREEFVSHLVLPGSASFDDLKAWATRLGIDFLCPRAAIALELTDERLSPDLALAELHRCQQTLATAHPELLSATISPRELVMVSAMESAGSELPESTLARRRLLALDAALRRELTTPYVLAMGVALRGIDGVALSYQSARQTIRVGRQRKADARVLLYHDLSLPVLLAGLGTGWQADQLRQPLQRLEHADRRGGVLRRTIETWFAHDGRAQPCARALHIHRNTLDYRLRQIGQATGLNLANTDDRLLLYIALQLG